jgi:hypothetical protein
MSRNVACNSRAIPVSVFSPLKGVQIPIIRQPLSNQTAEKHLSLPFFRLCGACSVLAGVTFLLAQLLPRNLIDPAELAQGLALLSNRIYYLWFIFFCVFLLFASMVAVSFKKFREHPFLTCIGLNGYTVFGLAMVFRTFLVLFARIRPPIRILDEMNPGFGAYKVLYLVLMIGMLVGDLFYGLAMDKRSGPQLERLGGVSLVTGASLTALVLLNDYPNHVWLSNILRDALSANELIVRLVIGIWLWHPLGVRRSGN